MGFIGTFMNCGKSLERIPTPATPPPFSRLHLAPYRSPPWVPALLASSTSTRKGPWASRTRLSVRPTSAKFSDAWYVTIGTRRSHQQQGLGQLPPRLMAGAHGPLCFCPFGSCGGLLAFLITAGTSCNEIRTFPCRVWMMRRRWLSLAAATRSARHTVSGCVPSDRRDRCRGSWPTLLGNIPCTA
jgi:hypothetical protein